MDANASLDSKRDRPAGPASFCLLNNPPSTQETRMIAAKAFSGEVVPVRRRKCVDQIDESQLRRNGNASVVRVLASVALVTLISLPAVAQSIEEKAQVCGACHGENG